MKASFAWFFLFASLAWADGPANRAAIDRTLAGLNQASPSGAAFTEDASSDLDRLPTVKVRRFQVLQEPAASDTPAGPQTGGATLVISHEPWGEAAIRFPGSGVSGAVLEVVNPRFTHEAAGFVTADVAVVDGAWAYTDESGAVQTRRLLFVMKKEGDTWKIASLRILANPRSD